MNKCFMILSTLLFLIADNFSAYSSHLIDEDGSSQTSNTTPNNKSPEEGVVTRSSSTTLNTLYAGAIVLASQIPTALALHSVSELDDGSGSANSGSGQSGISPPATGANPGVFYSNNIALTVSGAAFSVWFFPKVSEYILEPGAKYLWKRFYKITIDDVPVGPELENLNFFKKKWSKVYEKLTSHLYRSKIRDQDSVKFQLLRVIDESLNNHSFWVRKEIYLNQNFVGFTYESSICTFKIQNPLRSADMEMDEVGDSRRLEVWQNFAKNLIGKQDDEGIKIIPKKVYQAIRLLCLDNSGGQNLNRMSKNGIKSILLLFDPLCELLIEKSHHPFKPVDQEAA